ncbi:triose-phosphate isomerase [Tetragenococcus halophilus subsp. flandriensis]|uniref:triose-phosphate isomerase n=1 Tax=Tetragenococcus halophilus TaxID=51669 RepID=UPI0023EA2944|nr:triose-phosphate isomerase [Tetragenococcus halophilus]GMA09357.1 triose-phosphate isomerase [Tetragenococcus halophilus subsp. flandriensis]
MKKIRVPFFMFNPKTYLYGKELYDLAKYADHLAEVYDIDIFVTAPFTEIKTVSDITKNIIVTAQHMDAINPGRGMGAVLPESLYFAGARACVLNHAERPLHYSVLEKTINKGKKSGINTIVCANGYHEAKAIALLEPEIILCEPTDLIGTGMTSSDSYIKETIAAVKKINSNICVMQGAGVSTSTDIIRNLQLGSDANGATSGIIEANDPFVALKQMVEATATFVP